MPSTWTWEPDKIYWYFVHYSGGGRDTGVAKVRTIRHVQHLYPTLRIEKILTPDVWMGHTDRVFVGAEISANELHGGGASLADHYFDEHGLIKKLFTP